MVSALPPEVLEEINLHVACGFDNRERLFVRIIESMAEEPAVADNATQVAGIEEATVAAVRSAIEEAFARKEREAASWPALTDCDRLRAAFETLEQQGIVSVENCGFTLDEGCELAWDLALARQELGHGNCYGYCFFHEQDALRAAGGDNLSLAFGGAPGGEPGWLQLRGHPRP